MHRTSSITRRILVCCGFVLALASTVNASLHTCTSIVWSCNQDAWCEGDFSVQDDCYVQCYDWPPEPGGEWIPRGGAICSPKA